MNIVLVDENGDVASFTFKFLFNLLLSLLLMLLARKPVITIFKTLRVRFFGRIRKRICDPRSYGFFDTKETQNPKKDYFVMTRQAGGTQYICQNDTSLVLP